MQIEGRLPEGHGAESSEGDENCQGKEGKVA
jgi:hypothetical protein